MSATPQPSKTTPTTTSPTASTTGAGGTAQAPVRYARPQYWNSPTMTWWEKAYLPEVARGLDASQLWAEMTLLGFSSFADDIALTGRSPEAEPSPRHLEKILEEIRQSGATTVFTEPLVSPRLAQTVARQQQLAPPRVVHRQREHAVQLRRQALV